MSHAPATCPMYRPHAKLKTFSKHNPNVYYCRVNEPAKLLELILRSDMQRKKALWNVRSIGLCVGNNQSRGDFPRCYADARIRIWTSSARLGQGNNRGSFNWASNGTGRENLWLLRRGFSADNRGRCQLVSCYGPLHHGQFSDTVRPQPALTCQRVD